MGRGVTVQVSAIGLPVAVVVPGVVASALNSTPGAEAAARNAP